MVALLLLICNISELLRYFVVNSEDCESSHRS